MAMAEKMTTSDDLVVTVDPYLTDVYDLLGDHLTEKNGLYYDAQVLGTMLRFSSRLTWDGTMLASATESVARVLSSLYDLDKESPLARDVSTGAYAAVQELIPHIGIEAALLTVIYVIPEDELEPLESWHEDAVRRKQDQTIIMESVNGMLKQDLTKGVELWRVDEETKVKSWNDALAKEAKGCARNMLANTLACPDLEDSLELKLIDINEKLSRIVNCICAHYSFAVSSVVAKSIMDLIRKAGPKAVMVNIPLIMENADVENTKTRAMLGILIEDWIARYQEWNQSDASVFDTRAEIFFYLPNDGHDAVPIDINPPSNFKATPSGVANVSYTQFTTAEQDTFALEFKIVAITTLTVEETME